MISEFDTSQRTANGSQVKKGQPAREGLRTAREMAAEFGITFNQLTGYMGTAKVPPPKAEFCHRSRTAKGNEQRSYYRPSEMRAWWKAEQEAAEK